MSKKSKRLSVGLGLFLVFALAAGGAYAYWTNSGTGSGTATTQSPAAGQLTITGTTAITGLAPGVAAKPLNGSITNPAGSGSDFHVSGLSATISVDAAHVTAGCAASDYTLVQPTQAAADLAPGASVSITTGSIAFNNKATNQDFCKGATVTINYTIS
jgi:hypothetical protein